MQVKSYVRIHVQTNENDRGYVSISYNEYVAESYEGSGTLNQFFHLSLLFAFMLLNICIPLFLAKSIPLYYPKIRAKLSTGDFMECLYWTTATMAFLCNILYTFLSVRHQFKEGHPTITPCLLHMSQNCSIPSSTDVYHSEAFTLVAKVTIIPSAVFIELLISIYAIKFYSTTQSRYGRQCYVWRLYFVKTFHVLALWNILIAIQLFGMIAIALCTVLLIHPQVTIFLLLLLAMILVSLTLCTSYLLYHCQQQRRRRNCNPKDCGTNFLHSVLIITIMGLIVAFLAIYEVLLLVQAQIGTGVKGLLLSLLPSFPLSALVWYLKRRSQKKAAAANDERQLQPVTEEQQLQTTDSNIDVDPLLLWSWINSLYACNNS